MCGGGWGGGGEKKCCCWLVPQSCVRRVRTRTVSAGRRVFRCCHQVASRVVPPLGGGLGMDGRPAARKPNCLNRLALVGERRRWPSLRPRQSDALARPAAGWTETTRRPNSSVETPPRAFPIHPGAPRRYRSRRHGPMNQVPWWHGGSKPFACIRRRGWPSSSPGQSDVLAQPAVG